MKPPAVWFELSAVAGCLMVGMLAVMWAERPGMTCTMPPEGRRALVLDRDVDREHLANDLASANRIALRYVLANAEPSQQRARLADCMATLSQEIATLHGLAPESVRAHPTDDR